MYWWNFFIPKTIAKASLSICEYFPSVSVIFLDAKAIGLSLSGSIQCDETTPYPYDDASHAKIKG